jgi:hypothetical protein
MNFFEIKGATLLAFLFLSTAVCGQNQQALKVDVLGWVFQEYGLTYERCISNALSVQIGGGFHAGNQTMEAIPSPLSLPQFLVQESTLSGFFGLVEMRWYVQGQAGKGLYVAAAGQRSNREYVAADGALLLTKKSVGASAIVGFQAVKGKLLLDVFAGTKTMNDNREGEYRESYALFPHSGWQLRCGLNMGLAR